MSAAQKATGRRSTRSRFNRPSTLFRGPGEQPHRTSVEKRRTNMLSGIILQPGAWDATTGLLDDVLLAKPVHNVKATLRAGLHFSLQREHFRRGVAADVEVECEGQLRDFFRDRFGFAVN